MKGINFVSQHRRTPCDQMTFFYNNYFITEINHKMHKCKPKQKQGRHVIKLH